MAEACVLLCHVNSALSSDIFDGNGVMIADVAHPIKLQHTSNLFLATKDSGLATKLILSSHLQAFQGLLVPAQGYGFG